MKYSHTIILFLCMLFAVGCNSNYRLTGKVTFSEDGSPVTKGAVIFSTDRHIAQGIIKEDGSYIVGFEKLTDGIPPGDYRVHLAGTEDYQAIYAPSGERIDKYTHTIDPKYESPDTSGLTFKADGSQKTFDIQVEKAPPTRGR